MILYNVTTILDDSIHDQWLTWAENELIPAIMSTDCFVSYRVLRVLDSPNEGVTYCIQYVSDSLENYNEFKNLHPQDPIPIPLEFLNKIVSFPSLMEFIDSE